MARHPFIENLIQHMSETGMTIDRLLDTARAFDPDGYSREALRSSFNGSRGVRLRAMSALAEGADYPAEKDPYYRLAVVRYLLDEDLHGPEDAATNLEALKITGKQTVGPDEIKQIPIRHRKDAVKSGKKKSK